MKDQEVTQIPRFELEIKGEKGWATFIDTDDLKGRDIDRLRAAAGSGKNDGEISNNFLNDMLRLSIVAWEVPGAPEALLPKFDKSTGFKDSLGGIPGRFKRGLERHVHPFFDELLYAKKKSDGQDEDEEDSGPPVRPVSE